MILYLIVYELPHAFPMQVLVTLQVLMYFQPLLPVDVEARSHTFQTWSNMASL